MPPALPAALAAANAGRCCDPASEGRTSSRGCASRPPGPHHCPPSSGTRLRCLMTPPPPPPPPGAPPTHTRTPSPHPCAPLLPACRAAQAARRPSAVRDAGHSDRGGGRRQRRRRLGAALVGQLDGGRRRGRQAALWGEPAGKQGAAGLQKALVCAASWGCLQALASVVGRQVCRSVVRSTG